MHVLVLPPVTEVALPGEEAYKTALIDEAVTLGGMVVVLVDLGQTVGELIFLMVYRVREWQLHKIELREHLLHLRHYELAKTVVVVDMQEAAADEVVAQVLRLGVCENNVAVASHMHEGIVEKLGTAHIHGGRLVFEAHLLVGIAESYQVRQRRGIGVPVSPSAILQQRQLRLCR